jgi:uncharacterized membrane protein YhaH (DUF805 family)
MTDIGRGSSVLVGYVVGSIVIVAIGTIVGVLSVKPAERLGRSKFFAFVLVLLVIFIALGIASSLQIEALTPQQSFQIAVFVTLLLAVWFAFFSRWVGMRFQDMGQSRNWAYLLLLPVAPIVLLVIGCFAASRSEDKTQDRTPTVPSGSSPRLGSPCFQQHRRCPLSGPQQAGLRPKPAFYF